MQRILILFGLGFIRAGACGYCSHHFDEINFPLEVDTPVFYAFVAYQLLKFSFYYTTENFNEKAHRILIFMFWAFVFFVISANANKLYIDLNGVTDPRIISTKSLVCVYEILLYFLFEAAAEFLYCMKRPEYQEWKKGENVSYIKLFFQNLISLFGRKFSMIIEEKNESGKRKVGYDTKTTFISNKRKKRKPNKVLELKLSEKEIMEKVIQKYSTGTHEENT